MKDYVKLTGISKTYREYGQVLDSVDLSINKGERLGLLGASGSGKTTLLRIIAGLELADSGQIVLDGTDITNTPTQQRSVGLVFQDLALWPHMTVAQNVEFGLKVKRLPSSEINERVKKMLEMVELEGYEMRSIDSLSQGQQQRVALARSFIVEPKLLLLDEPMSSLDFDLKLRLLSELKALLAKLNQTCIYVTHDERELDGLTNRILELNNGVLTEGS